MAIFEKNLSVSPWSKLVLDVSRVSQNTASNYTTVSYKLYLQAWGGGYPWGRNGGYAYNVKIDGTTVASGTLREYKVPKNGTFLIKSGTRNINHDASGKKTVAVSGFFQAESVHGNATAAGSVKLPDIPRASGITSFTVSNITPTEFKFNYKVDKAVDTVQYSLNGAGWKSSPAGNIIKGLSPASSNKVKIRVKNTASQVWTESNTLTVSTLALSVMNNILDFQTNETQSIQITRSSSNMYHDIDLEVWNDDQTWHTITTLTNQGHTAMINLTAEEQAHIAEGRKVSTQITARIRLKSKWGSGGAIQGETLTRGYIYIAGATPTISGVSYKDTNATVQAALGDNQTILANKSNLQITIGSAAALKGATLKRYELTIGGKTYVYPVTGITDTNKVIDVGVVDLTGNTQATLTVVDSREAKRVSSFTIKGIAYFNPRVISVRAQRVADYGTDVNLLMTGSRAVVKTGLVDLNTLSVRYRVKEGRGVYSGWTSIPVTGTPSSFSATKLITGYDTSKTYTVEFNVKDSFTDWASYVVSVTEGVPLVKIKQNEVVVSVPVIDSKSKQPYIFFSQYDEW